MLGHFDLSCCGFLLRRRYKLKVKNIFAIAYAADVLYIYSIIVAKWKKE